MDEKITFAPSWGSKDARYWRIGGSTFFHVTEPWPDAEQIANTERLLGWKWCETIDPVKP